MTRCAICKGVLDRESPFVVYGRNPKTFRMAWMHTLCATDELETLKGTSTGDPSYEDQYDRYMQLEDNDK